MMRSVLASLWLPCWQVVPRSRSSRRRRTAPPRLPACTVCVGSGVHAAGAGDAGER